MKPRDTKAGKWVLAGKVAVDSGRLLITDYPDHPTIRTEALDERLFAEAKRQRLTHGDLPKFLSVPFELGHEGAGVSISTGLGDGLYDVWALVGDVVIDGQSWGKRVKEVRIQFITPQQRAFAKAIMQKTKEK